jgi:hypothetical protein
MERLVFIEIDNGYLLNVDHILAVIPNCDGKGKQCSVTFECGPESYYYSKPIEYVIAQLERLGVIVDRWPWENNGETNTENG